MILGAILGGILVDIEIAEAYEYTEVLEIQAVEAPRREVRIEVVTDWSKPGRIEQEIRAVFHEQPELALAVAKCESSLKMVQSHHQQPYGREESFGIFQIHARDHERSAKRLGLTEYKSDIKQNIQMARFIYDDAGGSFRPWSCYSKKMI